MNSKLTHLLIKDTVKSYLPNARVMLFGSRARGDNDDNSDYDLLIITPQTFTTQEKIHWSTKLDKAIVKALKVPIDLLLNSEEEIRQKLDLPGHVMRSVIKEGVAL